MKRGGFRGGRGIIVAWGEDAEEDGEKQAKREQEQEQGGEKWFVLKTFNWIIDLDENSYSESMKYVDRNSAPC